MAKKPAVRGTLRSLRSSNTFRDFVLDQLSGVRDVRARAMFGGIGLYAGETFFGLIANDVLYLKTDDTNRADYIAAGSEGFRPYPDKPMAMPYYNVPVDVLESAETLAHWAKASITIAESAPRSARRRK